MASIEKRSCHSLFIIFLMIVSGKVEGQETACPIEQERAADHGQNCDHSRDCTPENGCGGKRLCSCDGFCGYRCIRVLRDPYCLEELQVPNHAQVEYNSEKHQVFNTTATFTCDPGSVLIRGNLTRTCRGDGTWSGLEPQCYNEEEASPICKDGLNPGTISNGHVFMTEEPADNQRFREGTVLGYVCYDGYTLDGEQTTRTCLESGKWTAAKPKCINNDDTLGEQLEFDWNVYFIFDASNSVRLDFFKKGIYFAKRLVSKVGVGSIGSSGARYGATLLASTPTNLFHLSDPFNTVGAVTVALEQAAYFAEKAELLGHNRSDMHGALVHVEKEMLRSTPARTNATSVLFLITDGQSTGGNNLDEIANRLKTKYNFSIYCIGVGSEINRIASTPLNEHVFLFSGFLHMDQMVDAVTKSGTEFECGIGLGPVSQSRTRGRIIGGNNAGEGAWPWMVGLYYWPVKHASPEYFCGGSLIARNWILTAAGCFDSYVEKLPEDIIVTAGSNYKIRSLNDVLMPTRGLQILRVAEIIKHGQFANFDYDIALIELQTNAVLTRTVNPVCLPDPGLEANTDLLTTGVNNQPLPYVTGWGTLSGQVNAGRLRLSSYLQQLAIPLKGRQTCADSLVNIGYSDAYFTQRMMCAGYIEGEQTETGEIITGPRDACQGDSGGPLVRARRINGEDRYFQIGISSWGIGCAQPGHYGFYTHVPKLVDWVNFQRRRL